jgi:hypothetical protein
MAVAVMPQHSAVTVMPVTPRIAAAADRVMSCCSTARWVLAGPGHGRQGHRDRGGTGLSRPELTPRRRRRNAWPVQRDLPRTRGLSRAGLAAYHHHLVASQGSGDFAAPGG